MAGWNTFINGRLVWEIKVFKTNEQTSYYLAEDEILGFLERLPDTCVNSFMSKGPRNLYEKYILPYFKMEFDVRCPDLPSYDVNIHYN